MGFCNCSMFSCALLYVHSSFAIIFLGKRELVALLSFSSWCLVIVVWLFLAVLCVCLQFGIVVDFYFLIILNYFFRTNFFSIISYANEPKKSVTKETKHTFLMV